MRSLIAVTSLLALFLTSAVASPVAAENAVGIQARDAGNDYYKDDKYKSHKKECDEYKDKYEYYEKKIKKECENQHEYDHKKCDYYYQEYHDYKSKYDSKCKDY